MTGSRRRASAPSAKGLESTAIGPACGRKQRIPAQTVKNPKAVCSAIWVWEANPTSDWAPST